MSKLKKLISKTLKELKVRKKVNELGFERVTDEDGWDVIKYHTNSNDDNKTRERLEKLNTPKNNIDKK
jgi:hypothetical protein